MKKEKLLLILAVVLGFFLRFIHLNDWLYFSMDAERDAFIVKRILVDHHFTLIGGSIPGGIYLGPAWYYLSTIPFYLAKLNPVGLGVAASLLGVFSIWLIYYVGLKVFNKKIGMVSVILFATSFLIVVYNRYWWPLTLAPIVSLLTLLSLFKIIKQKKYKYAYLLSLALILGLQSDASNFILLGLVVISWILFRLSLKKKPVLIGFLLLLFSHLPLLFFDLRHDLLNSRAFLKLLTFQKQEQIEKTGFDAQGFYRGLRLFPNTFSRLVYTFDQKDVSKQLAICPLYFNWREQNVPKVLFILSSLILIVFVFKAFYKFKKQPKNNLGIKLISLQLVLTLIGITFFNLVFPGHFYEYFLSNFFPLFFLLLSYIIIHFLPYILQIGLVSILVFFNVKAVLRTTNSLGLSYKLAAVDYALDQVGGQEFYLNSLSTCFKYNGSRYLFYLKGHQPSQSFMDPHFSWLYDQPPSLQKPKLGAVFVAHDINETQEFWQQYRQYKDRLIEQKQFGDLEVLIIKDE